MAESNSNYHRFTKANVFHHRRHNKEFQEYRRRWQVYPLDHIVGEFPIHLDIESTYRCNLKCPFCARTYTDWGQEPVIKDMDFNLYKKIIDEGVENGLYAIKLSLRGEPLLHKRIVDMVAYAKERGIIDVYFNTNGSLLTEKLIYQMIGAGLDRISVSIDGIDKQYFENVRYPLKYDDIVNRIKNMQQIKRSEGVDYPQVRVQTVINDETMKDMDEYTEFWSEIADEVAGIDMRRESPEYSYKEVDADWCCPFLWQRMTILCDGTILPCLLHGIDDSNRYSLGNAKDVDIKDAWNNRLIRMMRAVNKAELGHLIYPCSDCSYRSSELEKLGYDSWYIDR